MPANRVPPEVKRERGTKERPPKTSQSLVLASIPERAPKGLSREARTAWRMAVRFAPKGVFTPLDIGLLEKWCRTYALYRKAIQEAENTPFFYIDPKGRTVEHPIHKTANSYGRLMLNIEKELGFSPVSRARVRPSETEEDDGNDFLNM